MSVGRAGCTLTPRRPNSGWLIVWEKFVLPAPLPQHSIQHCPRLCGGDFALAPLDGYAHKSQLRNRRSQQRIVAILQHCRQPFGDLKMLRMVRPTPRHQNIYIQQEPHGNEAIISCTDSVVSGGKYGAAAKIVTPVRAQRVVVTEGSGAAAFFARLRRNSETLSRSRFANSRIARASSSVTLNVSVFMLYYGITCRGKGKPWFPKNHAPWQLFLLGICFRVRRTGDGQNGDMRRGVRDVCGICSL